MTDIFLSYSSKDREKVRPIRDVLASMDYDVFWDLEIPINENWDLWIRGHLGRAKLAIVFWTPNSAVSPNVHHEVAIARKHNKLIPVMLDLMDPTDLPMGFYTTQAAMLHDWTGQVAHKGYTDLLRAVRKRFEGTNEQVAEVARKEEAVDIAALRKRAEGGDASAQVQLGYRYDVGQGIANDNKEAVRLYKLAADRGDAIAQSNLGAMYENGRGVAKDDTEAVRLYKLAADQGNALAQSNLGVMYVDGRGIAKDEKEAIRLFKLAAGRGNAVAQFNLGLTYAKGLGVEKDDNEAVRLYKLAADQGHTRARVSLAEMLENGKGGLQNNLDEAIRLYRLAAAQGSDYAQKALERLGK